VVRAESNPYVLCNDGGIEGTLELQGDGLVGWLWEQYDDQSTPSVRAALVEAQFLRRSRVSFGRVKFPWASW
jgi:hypothetical protein